MAELSHEIQELVDDGNFAEAEAELKQEISDLAAPATEPAAIELEILRRIRYDFSLDSNQVLEQIQASIPDATAEDVQRWCEAGVLQSRVIDGEVRYFRRSVSNLFRFSKEAQERRAEAQSDAKTIVDEDQLELTKHIEELVARAEGTEAAEFYPVCHRVKYGLTVAASHPRVKPGATIRVWLPYPQEYRQQRGVKLLSFKPASPLIAENGSPHRTAYFEQQVTNADEDQHFEVEFEFVTSASYAKLTPEKVEPYDTAGEVYQQYTAERAPHILFSPEVMQLAGEIVGSEKNPLEKARSIFRWVSQQVPWCAELEYSTIPSLSAKGLAARRGDCGVQGLTFVTLCRAAGVPARWQSGWQTKPGNWNMHDWSEIYIEPWGWLPVDASYGIREHDDPRVQDFLCGHMDPYRLIVNLDYGRPLVPPKTSFRSEPNDFQRGEVEIDGHNLYFDEWQWKFEVETKPLETK